MPEKQTIERARQDRRHGRSPTTQAGEYVREEVHKIRRGEHGARSAKQAIAIGLSKARRAGVDLPPPARGKASEQTRENAERAWEVGQGKRAPRAPREPEGSWPKSTWAASGNVLSTPTASSVQPTARR